MLKRRAAGTRAGRNRSPGVALLIVVAILAIVALLGAAALPSVAGYKSLKRTSTTQGILNSLVLSLQNAGGTKVGFHDLLNLYPAHLSQLNVLIVKNTSPKCGGGTFAGGDVTNWTKGGPFSGFLIVPWTSAKSGLMTPIGVIKDSVYKISNTVLAFKIDSVGTEDARNLDFLVDGGTIDSTTGNLTWVPATGITAGTPLHLVTFSFPNLNTHC